MKEYVLCYAKPLGHNSHYVTLIKKNRPKWQKGKYNLPGGKIENEETIIAAAQRELEEETGIHSNKSYIKIIGKIKGFDWVVWVCLCLYDLSKYPPTKLTDEEVVCVPITGTINNPQLIPNLKVIIPLCFFDIEGWAIIDGDYETIIKWDE